MPRRNIHEAAGQLAGILATCAATQNSASNYNLALLAGGFFGGWAGGRMPDILEPGISPNHRQFCHSVTCNGSALVSGGRAFVAWARERIAAAYALPDGADGRVNWQKALDLFVAGLIIGFAAGYASHIVLDAFTAKSLPLC